MGTDDIEYYRGRAATERARSAEAQREDVAEIHLELALMYEALVEQEALRPKSWGQTALWDSRESAA